jgi:AbrB family looped-hinge helix DNA binding protein
MSKVTVSPKFHVVLPQEVREDLALQPGQELEVFQYEGRIELVPIRPMHEMRGFLKGIDTSLDRDPDRF